MIHQGHRRHCNIIRYLNMVDDADATCDHTIPADSGTAGDGTASTNDSIIPDLYVVCYLYLIIDFNAIADSGIFQRSPVNTGIGTDLNIITYHYCSQLCNLVISLPFPGKPKAITADNHSCVQMTTPTNLHTMRQIYQRADASPLTNTDSLADDTVGIDTDTVSQCDIWPNYGIGPDTYIPSDPGTGMNYGSPRNTGLGVRFDFEKMGSFGVTDIGIVGQKLVASILIGISWLNDHSRCPGTEKVFIINRIVIETEISGNSRS